ncbi:hypothetical protein [Leptolyngbya ohadii]|nr:hypothetical protein [Leptolyngbya ohadii]
MATVVETGSRSPHGAVILDATSSLFWEIALVSRDRPATALP